MLRICVCVGVFLLLACLVLPMAAQQPASTITGSGTADFIPRFTGTTTIGNSNIFETIGGNVGVATTTPGAKLDVNGTGDVRDTLTLFPKLTHPTLSVHGTAFAVSHTGLVTFVSGQSFPGTGTVTSVGSGAGLTGGPITHSGTLSIATGGVTNSMLQNSTFTVNAGTGLTGGGTASLGAAVTLNLDTSKISVGYSTFVPSDLGLVSGYQTVAQTNTIATSGTYFISASVLPFVEAGDSFVFCADALASNGTHSQFGGSFQSGNYAEASITDVLFISAGDAVQLDCETGGNNGSFIFGGALTATLINSADLTERAHSRHPHNGPEQVNRGQTVNK
jgi:hypothetical protein